MEGFSQDKILEQQNKLNKREEDLKRELKQVLTEQQNISTQLAALEAQIENKNEEITNAKKQGNGPINQENLNKRCREIIENFLKDIYSDDNKNLNLPIRIEYEQMKIYKTLNNENMTFGKLKEETKLQFGKEYDEFFFGDEKGDIFLDDLNVISALFPLSNVKVDKYVPVIKVVNKPVIASRKTKQNVEEEEEIKPSIAKKSTMKELIGQFFKKNSMNLYFCGIFFIFLGFWIESCLYFRHADNYRTFDKFFNNSTFNKEKVDNLNYFLV